MGRLREGCPRSFQTTTLGNHGTVAIEDLAIGIGTLITERFYGEYVENFRKIGAISEWVLGEIVSGLQGLNAAVKRDCMNRVEKLLA